MPPSSVLKTPPPSCAPSTIPHCNPALRFKRGQLSFEPLGVIGIISPWNYPLSIPAADAFAALATGNAVVLKPSELTPQSALELERLIAAALDAEGLTTPRVPFRSSPDSAPPARLWSPAPSIS